MFEAPISAIFPCTISQKINDINLQKSKFGCSLSGYSTVDVSLIGKSLTMQKRALGGL